MVKCTEQMKKKIVEAKKNGENFRQIGRSLGISIATVSRVVTPGHMQAPPPKLGRRPIIDAKTEKFLVKKILTGQTRNATTAAKLLSETKGIQISSSYASNLVKRDLKYVKKLSKPKLLPHHKKARLKFCREHQGMGKIDWEDFIWSDESKIQRIPADRGGKNGSADL